MNVTTYQLAYTSCRVSLCARCAQQYDYPLGPVSHGQHHGECDEYGYMAHRDTVMEIHSMLGHVRDGEIDRVRENLRDGQYGAVAVRRLARLDQSDRDVIQARHALVEIRAAIREVA